MTQFQQPVMVSNDVARNPEVKPHAARLFIYLLAYKPEDGELVDAAQEFAGLDKATAEDAVNELINLGYMEKIEIVKNGEVQEVEHHFFPMGKRNFKKPETQVR